MGIVSEVLPVFSRKPLFGYSVVIFSGIAIGFLGWGVWAHHMFATGLGPVAISAFGLSTMLIAIPTGVKIFNWLGTVYGGAVKLTTAMLFSLGFIAMFTLGGLSGVLHSIVPADTQQTDTYFVVAHFHYVLFGGLVFGDLLGLLLLVAEDLRPHAQRDAGQGQLLDDARRVQPHVLPDAHPRPHRHAAPHLPLPGGHGLGHGSTMIETVGAFIIALVGADLLREHHLLGSEARCRRRRRPVGRPLARVVDPVAAARVQLRRDPRGRGPRRLVAPQVHRGRRGPAGAAARPAAPTTTPPSAVDRPGHTTHDDATADGHGIHLPSPSFYPLVLAAGLPVPRLRRGVQ